jgi:excisionase family DNA binding protein
MNSENTALETPLLSKTPDAARFLRCSEPTVRELIRSKRLAAVKVGRGYRISREALLAFVGGAK